MAGGPAAFPGAGLARCPLTGVLWLATSQPGLLLLRGTDRPAAEVVPAPATGGYL